jgi:hypothetical protein
MSVDRDEFSACDPAKQRRYLCGLYVDPSRRRKPPRLTDVVGSGADVFELVSERHQKENKRR